MADEEGSSIRERPRGLSVLVDDQWELKRGKNNGPAFHVNYNGFAKCLIGPPLDYHSLCTSSNEYIGINAFHERTVKCEYFIIRKKRSKNYDDQYIETENRGRKKTDKVTAFFPNRS